MSRERRDAIIAAKQGGGSPGITSGVSWDAYTMDGDTEAYLTSAKVYGTVLVSNAFNQLYNVETVDLQNTVEIICGAAFAACDILSNLIGLNAVTHIGLYAFEGCASLIINALPPNLIYLANNALSGIGTTDKIWVPISCISMPNNQASESQFLDCDSGLTIYCEAESKPAGWGEYWNYYDDTNQLTVVWGVSKAEFDALE